MKLLLLFLSATLFSCGTMREEVIPSELTEQSAKLVVDCFISPQDTILTAKVTRSRPVLDNSPLKKVDVIDALVTLSDGNQTVNLLYNLKMACYAISARKIMIRPGVDYTLTVLTPDGRQVTATNKVPTEVPLKTVVLDSTVISGVKKEYRILCSWQDQPNAYYRLRGTIRTSYQSTSSGTSTVDTKPVVFQTGDNKLGLMPGRNKAELLSASALLENESVKAPADRYRSTSLTVGLMHVDAAYYTYHEALDRQLQTADNPFAEAVSIPTNIQGGLGCFGSYNQSIRIIEFKLKE